MMRGGSDHMTTRAAGTSHARTSAGDGAHPHDAGDMPSVARAVARVLALAPTPAAVAVAAAAPAILRKFLRSRSMWSSFVI